MLFISTPFIPELLIVPKTERERARRGRGRERGRERERERNKPCIRKRADVEYFAVL
jgi:hypothetical protein